MQVEQFQRHMLRDEFLVGLPITESESAYLAEPSGVYESRRVFGRDLIVMWYRVPCNMVIQSVADPNWVIAFMPLNFEPSYTFDGRPSKRFDLNLCSNQNGYVTRGSGRNCIALGIRKPRLREMCAMLANGGIEEFPLRDFVLPDRQVIALGLHNALLEAATQSIIPLSPGGRLAMSETFESDFICRIAEMIVHTQHRQESKSLRLPAIAVVREAVAYSDTVTVPTLADLCAATGVSQRWLNKCFIDVVGLPPSRFLKLFRLSRARQQLLAAEQTQLLVKSLSLSMGYTSSGRFAADYRSVFGENPSDTIRHRLAA